MIHQTLDDLELETLELFLDSDAVHEECHNFITAHGFLTALAICPSITPDSTWIPIVFEEKPSFSSEKEEETITSYLTRLKKDIAKELESEDDFLVPCELSMSESEDELSELQEWASGFMEGVFLTESNWFASDKEEQIAELLLPMMVASDLFDDEEIIEIRKSDKLTQSCINQIPEVVTDLFLLLRTEPEKKTHSRKPNRSKHSKKK
ncbi:UPF0149 family protein [Marinomonas sp. 15G1-11]|uniref:UPF0149 family protein n=1 Tax=Marinomonas phaeophyticola TaxID=3004091 RepID=A0ABT4JR54_9GAMM|nr:UPF0149 family protein [Marinomonas sp. 15G1-11]MCZ2720303.1 UPF0149 family protein [Marinomonas sp. 15G1-11]